MHNDEWITDKYKQMNPQGAGDKIKEIADKNNPKVPISVTSSPLHSPQQRRNCSTNFNQDGKTRKVSTQLQLMNFTPHGNTHCPVPNNSRPQEQIRRCVCESHTPRTAVNTH